MENTEYKPLNFLEQIIEEDLKNPEYNNTILTRFPPEPNGYLHIGHAKAICLNFGLAAKYNGKTNLRFDDTNPSREEEEYVESIKEDIKWLGFDWEGREFYASDYFDQLYEWAEKLIMEGKAYVDDQPAETISQQRKSPTEPGVESPYRNRSVEENLTLFRRMKTGEFQEGEKVLRAKIDMSSPNMHMRDPIMYRIMHVKHNRTGDKWCIYPMYDWAHGESDYMEGITHSFCTLEFEVHRPLYDWFLDQVYTPGTMRNKQREFARLNLSYTVMSKRKLLELVKSNYVDGWDDPRMPTISGLRRRGYTPESIRAFQEKIGVAKRDNVIEIELLEFMIREDLNKKAPRVMAVIDPVKLIIDNYPENKTEYLVTENNPEDPSAGTREIPFTKEIYIERNDFMEDPPKKFFRLSPGNEVRLKSAFIIKCTSVEKDADGKIIAIHCEYDPETRSGGENSGRKVKGTLHWVSAEHAINAEVRIYDRLFKDPNPDGHRDINYLEFLNPDSITVKNNCKLEPSLANAKKGVGYQFQRLGYFCLDKYADNENLVFNKTVGLKDTWSKNN
ncbi:glutamine--tRNA ligase/YqeY domain fusion protein [Bacteroidales bacterium OttesenSCG-928-K03]|nr:glutamine--tRNA ligase/YqeY domain fusion protein [Bacteroidales bacterium OttesenSCG-928-K22]MDL2242890.1 glutamine--tRNA ligase/YqeY domain fusion protein [Bacteroidales bacterium OttesenSCG-928-K03]